MQRTRETLSGRCNGTYELKDKNAQLDIIYDWLCSLGYEMSTEEQQLQDGTHPLFKTKEELLNE